MSLNADAMLTQLKLEYIKVDQHHTPWFSILERIIIAGKEPLPVEQRTITRGEADYIIEQIKDFNKRIAEINAIKANWKNEKIEALERRLNEQEKSLHGIWKELGESLSDVDRRVAELEAGVKSIVEHRLQIDGQPLDRITFKKDAPEVMPIIKVYQQDWVEGFACFVAGSVKEDKPRIGINIGALISAVECGDIPKKELPYFIAQTIMHEVIHALEEYCDVDFSEERVEQLIEQYEPKAVCEPRLWCSVHGFDSCNCKFLGVSKPATPDVPVITISRVVANNWLITMHERLQTQDMDKHDQEMVFELRKAMDNK